VTYLLGVQTLHSNASKEMRNERIACELLIEHLHNLSDSCLAASQVNLSLSAWESMQKQFPAWKLHERA